jgi:hypothetical protein
MQADRVMFFKLGHKLLAVALHKNHVIAKQFADTGYWFANTLNQLQLDKKTVLEASCRRNGQGICEFQMSKYIVKKMSEHNDYGRDCNTDLEVLISSVLEDIAEDIERTDPEDFTKEFYTTKLRELAKRDVG